MGANNRIISCFEMMLMMYLILINVWFVLNDPMVLHSGT